MLALYALPAREAQPAAGRGCQPGVRFAIEALISRAPGLRVVTAHASRNDPHRGSTLGKLQTRVVVKFG